MVNKLISKNERESAKTEFLKIFIGVDPFGEIYSDSIEKQILLYPTDGYYLTQEQFSALTKTVVAMKESGFYVSEIESEQDCFLESTSDKTYQCGHWVADNLVEFTQYMELPLILENAIYSTSGNWGVIVSHEEHAVLGGSAEFVELFKTNYMQWTEDLASFEKVWEANKERYGSDLSWIHGLLNKVSKPVS